MLRSSGTWVFRSFRMRLNLQKAQFKSTSHSQSGHLKTLWNFILYYLVTHTIFGFQYTNIIHISDTLQFTKYFSLSKEKMLLRITTGRSSVISTTLISLQVFELLSFTSIKSVNQWNWSSPLLMLTALTQYRKTICEMMTI